MLKPKVHGIRPNGWIYLLSFSVRDIVLDSFIFHSCKSGVTAALQVRRLLPLYNEKDYMNDIKLLIICSILKFTRMADLGMPAC